MPTRYLGVDLGSKRIGLALGEPEGGIVSPLKVLEARPDVGDNARAIVEVADQYAVDGIVMGLPLNMDGTEGSQARASKALAEAVRGVIASSTAKGAVSPNAAEGTHAARPTVYMHDERLTSHAADRRLAERRLTHKRKAARQDAVAAQIMLQSFFQCGGRQGR